MKLRSKVFFSSHSKMLDSDMETWLKSMDGQITKFVASESKLITGRDNGPMFMITLWYEV